MSNRQASTKSKALKARQGLPAPIFVLTPPALPGSTLAAALGQNSAAYAVMEINLPLSATVDAFLREMTGARATQAHGLLRTICELYAGEQTVHAVDMARRWLNRRDWMATGTVMTEIAARMAPLRMVMPVTAALFDGAAMKRLISTFPDASFVVLRAHPRIYGHIALNSEAGRVALQLTGSVDESYEPPLPDPQKLWLRSEEAMVHHLAEIPPARVHSLRVEDLARNPKSTLSALSRALGLPSGKAEVAAMLDPEGSPFAGPGPIGAHSKSHIISFEELAEEVPDSSEEILEGALPWRPDDAGFVENVKRKATELGLA